MAGQVYTVVQNYKGSKRTYRRYASKAHRNRAKGRCPLSLNVSKVEEYVLGAVYQLGPADLLTRGAEVDAVAPKRGELAGVEGAAC